MTSITDWTDRNTCVIFGDGAGAAVVGPTEEDRGLLSIQLHADGRLSDLICVPGGGSSIPASEFMLAERLQFVKMRGNETFKIAVKTMEGAVREAVAAQDLTVADIDFLDQVIINLDRIGNTSAASIPLALDEAVRAGQIQPGSLIVLAAFGAGLTWASGVIRW